MAAALVSFAGTGMAMAADSPSPSFAAPLVAAPPFAAVQVPVEGGTLVIPRYSTPIAAKGAPLRAHTNIRRFVPRISPAVTAIPEAGPPVHDLPYETPASLACIYGMVTASAGCKPDKAKTVAPGGSRAIAIVDAYHYPTARNDLTVFSKQFGLPVPTTTSFQVVYAGGTKPPRDGGWEMESALDIEWAHAMAPHAKLYLVEAQSNEVSALIAAVRQASTLVAAAGGGQISMSWGSTEFTGQGSYDSAFAHAKVTYFAATGDAPGVSWPSASPKVVAVGGTTIVRDTAMAYRSQSVWSWTGGGLSARVLRPSYQDALASRIGSHRGLPDVAAVADPYSGVWVYNSGAGGWQSGWGGTSLATPVIAAMVNAAGHTRTSSAAELVAIYGKLNGSGGRPGSNGVTDIIAGTCGTYGAIAAVAGWDRCTGVGVPNSLQFDR